MLCPTYTTPARTFLTTEALIDRVRAVARSHGWAIGVHGSLKRDIDLIAAPWTEAAIPCVDLWDRLAAEVPLWPAGQCAKPHGRIGRIFLQPGSEVCPDRKNFTPAQLDISFMVTPRTSPPAPPATFAYRRDGD